MPKKKGQSVFQTTLAVTLLVFISKAGGFLRETIMAAYYGTNAAMDAYNSAYSLYYVPVLLFNSCITSTLIPIYTRLCTERGIKRANRFCSNAINLFALAALFVSILMFLLADPLVRITNGGYSPEKQRLTVELLRIMLPSLVFLVTSIVLSSLLNAREKYLAAQLTGFPITVALIAATVLFSSSFGIHALAWGVFVSGILQVVILLPALKGFRYHLHIDFHDKSFHHLLVLACPAVLSMAVNELNHLIDRFLATGLGDGVVAGMNFAYKLITFLMGVLLVPLTTIMFSRMSMRAAQHDSKSIARIVMRCIETVALIILPITAICVVMAEDVIRAAYMRGQFDASSVAITAGPFLYYVIGVFAFGVRDLINRAFHATEDTRTPMVNSAITVVMNIAFNLILVRLMGASGLALATSISGMIGAAMLFIRLRRKLGRMRGWSTAQELIKIVISTVICTVVCIVLHHVIPAATDSLTAIARLVLNAILSLGVYALCAVLLRVRQVNQLFKMVLRR